MDHEHDRLFNMSWWAGALIQRRQLDALAHVEGREQQSVDPHAVYEPLPADAKPGTERAARPLHGASDYTLTEWERSWIRDRVVDVLRDRLLARQEHAPVLDESLEAHEARELEIRAKDYFGASHEETRAKLDKLRTEHEKHRADAIAGHRSAAAGSKEKEHYVTLLAGHETALAQIDSYIEPGKGLVDRHIATVKTDVAEKRRIAQQHIDDCGKVLEVPFESIVATYTAFVETEIRSWVAPVVATAEAKE